jgi:small subunit ribosomal protein S1
MNLRIKILYVRRTSIKMSKLTSSWDSKNIIDDVDYREEDSEIFKKFLYSKDEDGEQPLKSLIAGNVLKGRIVEITKDFVVIDVGLKSEGLVPVSEFTEPSELVLGNIIEAFLDQEEGDDGQIVLSRDKARRLRQWEDIVENADEGSIVKGKVIRKVKGGLMVDIGVEAFLPGSQIDNKRIKNIDEYLDNTYEFKILKINKERKNIVLSRRELLEEERMTKKGVMLENFNEGELYKGIVKNITDFGVFVDIDGVDGLLHVTDMAWKRIRHPSEMVAIGDTLEVIILNVDKDKRRVALGMKQKEVNPWEEIELRYPVGTKVKGRVTSVVPYGGFVEIEPGVEGLIHVTEISWTKIINDPNEVLKEGDVVEVVVLGVHKEEGKISLGMKQLESNPWNEVDSKYPVGSTVTVEVRSLTNYGVSVEVEPGIDGLIHLSDISWIKKISHPSELLKKEDKIEAVVLFIDKENKKITLGMKQLEKNPWENIEKIVPLNEFVRGVVTKITAFGAFVDLENGLEGLIHVTELSDKPFGKVEEVVAKGQAVVAKVIKIDPEHKKISLSIKEHLIDATKENPDDIVVGSNKKKPEKKKPKGKKSNTSEDHAEVEQE